MKKIITFLIVMLVSNTLFSQENLIPPTYKERPADFEYLSAPDSTGKRILLKTPSLNNTKATLKLPYPIIFIHGLVGSSSTWDITTNFMDSQYSFTYGGRFDFCLNYDGDNTIANKNFYPTTGSDLALFTPTLIAGDYYYLNFDVGLDGSNHPNGGSYDSWSNQQAIVKQGLAVKWAIYYVLQITGRDKVILMGHSMGGLTAREYLQNPNIWQSDGKHHVAKLVTSGTPHGGSNSTSFGLGAGSVNEKMDATRDLRRDYYISESPGVYLFGGIESNSVINNNLFFNYYNVDVNCNGIYGENNTGLNQKGVYNNLDYSCIIGECSGCLLDPNPGDGVVWDVCADLKNYYNSLPVNRFYYYGSATTQIHTDLTKQNYENMQGLDEPNEYVLSYDIELGKTYTGFITLQPFDGYPYDYDDYKFSVINNSNINVTVSSIALANLMVRIVDLSGNIVGTTVQSSGLSSVNFTQNLSAGSYYLEIFGTPTSSSYYYPYKFLLVPETGIADITNGSDFLVYPNPANELITIKANNNSILGLTYTICDQLGSQVLTGKITNEITSININQLATGIYLLQIGQQMRQAIKVVKK